MSKFKQRHLLENGDWHIEFKPNSPKVQYARLELENGGVILGTTAWTEEVIRREIAKDEGMNKWQWVEVKDEPVFDAHGFYVNLEVLTASYGKPRDEPVFDYIKSKLDENATLEDEIEGIKDHLCDKQRVAEAISTERLLNLVLDGNHAIHQEISHIGGRQKLQYDMLTTIHHNTDDAEKLSRIAIIVSLFGTLATLGVAAIAFSMLGGK